MAKYGIIKGCAYSAKRTIAVDSIGQVLYALKSNSKISLENLTDLANQAFITPQNTTLASITIGVASSIDCFYKTISSQSAYFQSVTLKNVTTTGRKLTQPTINLYKIKLSDTISTLEIRNNDPWILKHTDVAPFDIVTSIAITNAEVQNIHNSISSNLDDSPKSFDFSNKQLIQSPGYRSYYKLQLYVNGSSKGSPKQRTLVETNVFVYSVDGCNWISSDYASAAFILIDGYTWDNQIIPNSFGDNPFGTNWTPLKSNLNSIIQQANTLPTTNDKGSRLLNQAIRDYIYQGDLYKVTFEMAFRLPFYLENGTAIPYQIEPKTSKFNNPYYKAFDDWFGYANSLRTNAGIATLTESGKTTEEYVSTYHDYNLNYQQLLLISSENASYSVTNHIPAFISKNFDFENRFSKKTFKPNVPGGGLKYQGTARNLDDLVSSNMITASAKSGLENGSIIYAKVANGTYDGESVTNGVITKVDDKYYLKIYFWPIIKGSPNHSGLTFGFGYDIGQNKSPIGFTANTGIVIPTSGIVSEAIHDALGKKEIAALTNYYTYFDSVWNTDAVKITRETAIQKAVALMKGPDYLRAAVSFIAKIYIVNGQKTDKLFLRTFQPNFGFFFNEGNTHQFLNEMEKVFLLSLAYNKGAGSVNPDAKKHPEYRDFARKTIHAFNTHDIRYLQYAINTTEISHRAKIANTLNSLDMNNYFQNFQ